MIALAFLAGLALGVALMSRRMATVERRVAFLAAAVVRAAIQ